MRVFRARIPECFLDEDLAWRIRDMVFPANDVADVHLRVVNDDREVVKRVIYRPRYDEILELCRVERDIAAHQVGECNGFPRIAEPHDFRDNGRVFLTRLF